LRGGTGKFILRNAIAPWLPPSVMKRPKQGFQIPHTAWLRGAFGSFAREMWHDSGAASAGYLDIATVDRLFAEHQRGEADHARLLYTVAVFAIWWQQSSVPVQEVAA
jgi:asparagine synthase (glutamine-hydrolysing)